MRRLDRSRRRDDVRLERTPLTERGVDDELDGGYAGRLGPPPKLVVEVAGDPAPCELVRQRNGQAPRSYADSRSSAEPDGELLGAEARPEVISERAPQRINIRARGSEKVRTHRAPIRRKSRSWRAAGGRSE